MIYSTFYGPAIERVELLPIPDFDLTEPQRKDLQQTLVWTKRFFDSAVEGNLHIGGHGFDKTIRQAGAAAYISSREGWPVFLPTLTAMIMDVGRTSQDPRARTFEHGLLSREMVVPLLDSLDSMTEEAREVVANATEDHPKLNENVRRSYVVEAAMDADRLDCLGALGPLRAASWRPNIPLILPEEIDTSSGDSQIQTVWQDMFYRQLGWVDMLWTQTAREIAGPRVEFYRLYLAELKLQAGFMYEAYGRLGLQLT